MWAPVDGCPQVHSCLEAICSMAAKHECANTQTDGNSETNCEVGPGTLQSAVYWSTDWGGDSADRRTEQGLQLTKILIGKLGDAQVLRAHLLARLSAHNS